MKIGDNVRARKTNLIGVITGVQYNSGPHYTVEFHGFGTEVCIPSDIEPWKPINPCVCCGAESVEGELICGACMRK